MYSRSYPGGVEPPERYDGAAIARTEEYEGEENESSRASEAESEPVMSRPSSNGLFSGISLDSLLGGFLQKGRFNLSSIGLEEILIIIAALYMMFSKDGDRECAVMLIILLFIT